MNSHNMMCYTILYYAISLYNIMGPCSQEEAQAVAAAALQHRAVRMGAHRLGDEREDVGDRAFRAALGVREDPLVLDIVVEDVDDRAEDCVHHVVRVQPDAQLRQREGQPRECARAPEAVLRQPPIPLV